MFKINKLQADQVQSNNYLRVSVDGYWSEPVSISVTRKSFDPEKPGKWEFEVSNSSGGKDDKEIDYLTSSVNFAHAILAAVEYCRELEANQDWLESCYKENRRIAIEELRAKEAKRQAEIDADVAVGDEMAKTVIDQMLKDSSKVALIASRGTDPAKSGTKIYTYQTETQTKFGIGRHGKLSRTEALKMISESSYKNLVVTSK